jgi:hypothetical protein
MPTAPHPQIDFDSIMSEFHRRGARHGSCARHRGVIRGDLPMIPPTQQLPHDSAQTKKHADANAPLAGQHHTGEIPIHAMEAMVIARTNTPTTHRA